MKSSKVAAGIALALAALTAAESAMARPRARVSIGIGFGVPLGYGAFHHHYWGGPYSYHPYYYPPAYYPAPVVIQQQPTVYIEQPQAAPSVAAPAVQSPAQPQGYWYYCADSRAYYPYVKDCPAGWQRVAPQPN